MKAVAANSDTVLEILHFLDIFLEWASLKLPNVQLYHTLWDWKTECSVGRKNILGCCLLQLWREKSYWPTAHLSSRAVSCRGDKISAKLFKKVSCRCAQFVWGFTAIILQSKKQRLLLNSEKNGPSLLSDATVYYFYFLGILFYTIITTRCPQKNLVTPHRCCFK